MGQKNSLPMEGVDGFSVEEVNFFSFFFFSFLLAFDLSFFCIIFLAGYSVLATPIVTYVAHV